MSLRDRNKREKRRRIQCAAQAVFAEKGYAAATTREIAQRAEVGTGTIFLYARDKHDLLMMVVNDALDELIDRAIATLPDGTLIEQLVHFFSLRFAYWARDLELSRNYFHEAYPSLNEPPDGRLDAQRFHERRSRLIDVLAGIVAAQQRDGNVSRAVDCDLAAHLIFDLYLGENRKWLARANPNADDAVAQLRRVLELALRSFAMP